MNDRNHAAGKLQVIRTVCELFQSSSRRYQREEGTAFQRNMEARAISDASYITVTRI